MRSIPRFASSSLNLSNSAYVNIGNPESLQTALSFTLEAWVFLNDATGTQTILSKHSEDSNGAFMLLLEDGVPITYYRQAPYYLKSPEAISINDWHHIATSYDAQTGLLTLYVDGVQKKQGTFDFSPLTSSSDDILFGADGGSSPKNFLQGMIGRIEIWTICRDLEKIVDDSVQVREPAANPFLEVHFDFSVLPATDQSGNNIPISFEGGANYCISIPGVKLENNAYVNCGNNPDLSFDKTKPYTLEGWFCPTAEPGTIVSKFNGGNTGEYSLTLNDSVLSANRNTFPHSITSQKIITDNSSYFHFAMVFNGKDKTLSLYINGNLQASKYFMQDMEEDLDTDFLIGAIFNNGTPDNFFQGYIQNIRVWNKALTTAEVKQWMYNQPVNDVNLVASFDFTVDPPVDNTDQHSISLENGAAIDELQITIEPDNIIAQMGIAHSINAAYMNETDVTPAPTPDITITPPEKADFELLSMDFKQTIQKELEDLMEKNNYDEDRRKDHRKRFEESYKKAQQMFDENPDLKKAFTTIRENGRVKIIHHTLHGDEVIFEADAVGLSDCTIWWISFTFKLTIGFFQALGLLPSFGDIAKRVYNLVSQNERVIQALSTLLGKAITVSGGVSIIAIIYKEGLMWPILKLAFASAGWWTLFWILKKVIAIATGLEAAELLSGFIVWAAQLTVLSLEFQTSCPTNVSIKNN